MHLPSFESSRAELAPILQILVDYAPSFLERLDEAPVRSSGSDDAADAFAGSLPETGSGAVAALRSLIEQGTDAAINSSGPRFFHFVMGGSTPAALGADWLTSLLDQVAFAWVSSPLAVKLETLALSWLQDLFQLGDDWGGVMTTGATMANFVGLASARQWVGEQNGIDIAESGVVEYGPIPVFSSGYVHASSVKVLGMLGMGRSSLRVLSRDSAGRLNVRALENALEALDGRPSIIIANAGEVNTGDFDPIEEMVDLAEEYHSWLHVDGAFGLFARLTPTAAHLARGAERAQSITVDGHKWLNVPYDTGFAFVRDPALLGRTFAYSAAYLPDASDPRPNMGNLGPESSRRARGLAVWATLQAYGREGYRKMVERHLGLARRLAALVDEAPDLERLADVPLNIVCFRYNPGGVTDAELDRLNERLGQAILRDGRVYAGTTKHEGRTALRPAIVNWRTREEDVDLFVRVVRELAEGIARS